MRFALRNQDKIIKSIGENGCKILLKSLDKYFAENEKIEGKPIHNGKYHEIFIPSVAKRDETFKIIIIGTKYDVCTLAYFSTLKLNAL